MVRTQFFTQKLICAVLFATAGCLLPTSTAHATPLDYTFSGNGGGTINGVAFTGAFNFTFVGDTTQIQPFGSEFILPNATGTFSEGGTTYVVDPIFGIISNPDPLFPRVGFFNSDITNGLTINNSAVAGYNLGSALGPITAPNPGDPSSLLFPTLGGTTGFSLDSGLDKLILTSDYSLTFTAAPPSAVPEPSTFALLTAGIAGIGVLRRRFSL
jgi:PEP-CTERM motif